MGGKERAALTEPTFYVLMAFLHREVYREEPERLRACVRDGEEELS